ncbi:helix-turn-helix domain-containing protein [Caldicellulosiruptoraceae bacterium PP1]
MQALHELNILEKDFPFRLFFTESIEFPPHWHEAIEVVYVIEGNIDVGVNNELFKLDSKDILIIGMGDVHYYKSNKYWNKIVVIQFDLDFYNTISNYISDRKYSKLLLSKTRKFDYKEHYNVHKELENQIISLIEEYNKKLDGYKMAIKARLLDILVLLLRNIDNYICSVEKIKKHFAKLERLEKIFDYIENNYHKDISLDEIAQVANYSTFHFTRFFKQVTGMTFSQYLSIYRIKRAEWLLINKNLSIAEIAMNTGFNSIKTFNRVFKNIKGCSPTEYKKQYLRND